MQSFTEMKCELNSYQRPKEVMSHTKLFHTEQQINVMMRIIIPGKLMVQVGLYSAGSLSFFFMYRVKFLQTCSMKIKDPETKKYEKICI